MTFYTLYQRFFAKDSVRRQLVKLFLTTVMIPFLLIGSLISGLALRQMLKSYEELAASRAMQVRSMMLTTSIHMYSVCSSILTSESLQRFLCTDPALLDLDQEMLIQSRFLSSLAEDTAFLSGLTIYLPRDIIDRLPHSPYFSPVTEETETASWYQEASVNAGLFCHSGVRTGQGGVSYHELHYYCRIPLPRMQTFAVMEASISNDYLRNLAIRDTYGIYMSVNGEPVFFSSDRSWPGNPPPLDLTDSARASRSGLFRIAGKLAVASIQALTPYRTDDRIHILVVDPLAVPRILRLGLAFFLTVLASLSASALILFFYARYFSERITALRDAMSRASQNHYQIASDIPGDDELTAAFQDLKIMVEKLRQAEARIYQTQLNEQFLSNQQQQMELKLLASQINPHFLYNTLETIRMKAFSQGNREVANAIRLLGKSMRYVLGSTRATLETLDRELDYINTWLSIQKMRFGERINYDIRVDERIEPQNCRILPLLIQPLVENAITHGIEPTGENGRLILHIERPAAGRGDILRISIFDNGAGMDRETLSEVLTQMESPGRRDGHGIGLYNINNRIRLFYKTDRGLTIKSRPGLGTLVSLTIPYFTATEEDV